MTTTKAISVRQTRANAIMLGKNVENRSRYFSHRGPLLIHASMKLFQLTISRPELSVPSSWGFQMSSRLRTASLFALIAVAALSILPKIDLPETAFDETDRPTVQTILTTKATPFRQYGPSRTVCVPMAFAGMPKARVRNISPAYTQSSESRHFRAICILRC
jgi:hypothetical protein